MAGWVATLHPAMSPAWHWFAGIKGSLRQAKPALDPCESDLQIYNEPTQNSKEATNAEPWRHRISKNLSAVSFHEVLWKYGGLCLKSRQDRGSHAQKPHMKFHSSSVT
ncbi:hypothetical protein DBV39_16625 [Orrella marina]|uniref:Uncharacterized protein n=1 Tax=Orrella marina TaxID=2163011 RepID=A0A2R4XMQ6_9BURK|nr:hypothetical protein DBV39_16625 [Orrella marina]